MIVRGETPQNNTNPRRGGVRQQEAWVGCLPRREPSHVLGPHSPAPLAAADQDV